MFPVNALLLSLLPSIHHGYSLVRGESTSLSQAENFCPLGSLAVELHILFKMLTIHVCKGDQKHILESNFHRGRSMEFLVNKHLDFVAGPIDFLWLPLVLTILANIKRGRLGIWVLWLAACGIAPQQVSRPRPI